MDEDYNTIHYNNRHYSLEGSGTSEKRLVAVSPLSCLTHAGGISSSDWVSSVIPLLTGQVTLF